MSDSTRLDAITFVQHWYADHPADRPRVMDDVLAVSKTVAKYLIGFDGGVIVRLRSGPVTDQLTGLPVQHSTGGSTMQLHDNEQVSYTLSAADSKGVAISGDTFTASSDNTAAVTIVANTDGSFLAVAGLPGSAVVTFTDGTLSVTEAIDVVVGTVSTILVTAGAVEVQP